MDRSFVESAAEDRARLRALVDRLTDDDLRRPVEGEWTVSALLAHLAFWDRWVQRRWDHYERDGAIADIPEIVLDLANAAALPVWRALDPRLAIAEALDAAETGDRRIASLSDDAVAHARATDRPTMLDRSLHRREHLDQIQRALSNR